LRPFDWFVTRSPLAAQPAPETAAQATPAETQLDLHRQLDISALRAATVPYGQAGRWSVRIDQVAKGMGEGDPWEALDSLLIALAGGPRLGVLAEPMASVR
jgi:hypothetical protein